MGLVGDSGAVETLYMPIMDTLEEALARNSSGIQNSIDEADLIHLITALRIAHFAQVCWQWLKLF